MPKVIQIRDVPDDLHDQAVKTAAAEGISLNAFARRALAEEVHRRQAVVHNQQIMRRARRRFLASGRKPLGGDSIAAAVREGRTSR